MKIEGARPQLLAPEVTKVKKSGAPAATEQAQEQSAKVTLTDQVTILSKKAQAADVTELQAAQDAKIEAVKARLQQGTYEISGQDLAKKMVARSTR